MNRLTVITWAAGQPYVLGEVGESGRQLFFQYSPEALARRLEHSPVNLPLQAKAYPESRVDFLDLQGLPGLIHDALPDGWGYRLMDKRLQVKGVNPALVSVLDRLAAMGSNTMGALTFEPADEIAADTDLTLLDLAAEVQALLQDEDHEILPELLRVGGSPGGARPKAQVYYNPVTRFMSTQPCDGGEPWLVKFLAKDDEPDSCAVEAAYTELGRRAGLRVEPHAFFDLGKAGSAFALKRFDRGAAGQRYHIHTLAGLLNMNFRVPALGYSDFLRVTSVLTQDIREVEEGFRRCIFNVLMNNRDDHAKNLSFRMEPDGTWKLSPAYDLTYCVGNSMEHFMDIAGERRQPTRQHVLQVAQAGSLREKRATRILDEMLAVITPAAFKAIASHYPVKAKTVQFLAKMVAGHRNRLG